MKKKSMVLVSIIAALSLLLGTVSVAASDETQDPEIIKRQMAAQETVVQGEDSAPEDASSQESSDLQEDTASLQASASTSVSPFTGSTYTHSSTHASGDYELLNGIDVSSYQGTIDWAKAAAGGVEFAFIRAGYRGYGNGTIVSDAKLSDNIQGCDAQNLPYGVYFFSQAVTTDEAVEEANTVLAQISGKNVTLPIVMDYELVTGGRLDNAKLSKSQATAIATAFCERIKAAGYTPMVYANADYLKNNIDGAALSANGYQIWMANFAPQSSYASDYDFWQYSETGTVPGISGKCNCDFYYAPKGSSKLVSFSGNDRYQTMNRTVAAGGFATGGTVYVTTGEDFPDALAAAGICGLTGSPLVTTAKNSLSASALSALKALDPSHIVIVGGAASVGGDTENAIDRAFPDMTERISGIDRYATALNLYQRGSGWSNMAIVVDGEESADALSAAPYAYAAKCPIFLSHEASGLDDTTLSAIRDGGFTSVLLVGGPAAIPESVESQLQGIRLLRLAGVNRYDTCSQFAGWAMGETDYAIQPQVTMNCEYSAVATGVKYADALAGAALCGSRNSVLFLADPGITGLQCIQSNLKDYASSVKRLYLLGGTAAIPDSVRDAIRGVL